MYPLTMVWVMLAAASSGSAGSSWENVYEVAPGRHNRIDTVHAKSRDDWYMAGSAGLLHNIDGVLKLESTLGASVQTIWDAGTAGLFALGDNQLVMHFDGTSWIIEHLASRPNRKWVATDVVYVGFIASDLPDAPLVAVGLSLALVRRADHTWMMPPQPDRQNLVLLGQVGRQDKAPRGCHQAEWLWLGKEKAFFTCHEGQSFVYDNGRLTARGKLPRACEFRLTALATDHDDLYASCDSPKILKGDAAGWHPFGTIAGEKQIRAISVAGGCVFAAGRNVVWRSCSAERNPVVETK